MKFIDIKCRKFFSPTKAEKMNLSKLIVTIGLEFNKINEMNKIVNYLIKKYKDKLSIKISSNNFVNINNLNITKWNAIIWLAKKWNVNDTTIVTFGDSLNDKYMLFNSDLGITMGNIAKN